MEEIVEAIFVDPNDPGCMTFALNNEDHTIGNALRHFIMKNSAVEFCGYTSPHPSESKIHLRIQTNSSITAIEALRKGLEELSLSFLEIYSLFKQKIDAKDYDIIETDKW